MFDKKLTLGIVMFASLTVGSTSFAFTNCADATGSNRYAENNYRGGPMPMPTTVVDDVKIFLDGQMVSESTTQYNGTKVIGPWAVNPVQSTKVIVNKQSQWVSDYVVQVSIDPTRTLPRSFIFWMVCHQDDTPVP